MLIEYCGERYFVKLQKIDNPSADPFDDMNKLQYFN